MQVDVMHALARLGPRIHDQAIAGTIDAFPRSQRSSQTNHRAEQRIIRSDRMDERPDVPGRNDQDVRGGSGVLVAYGHELGVTVKDYGVSLTLDDAAENAILHQRVLSPRTLVRGPQYRQS
jgi:hypothetical protein